MQVLPTAARSYKPPAEVEIPVNFDGFHLRVDLEKDAVLELMHAPALTSKVVDAFLRLFHTNIMLAIEAHLYAYGVPLDRHLVLSLHDFGERRAMWRPS